VDPVPASVFTLAGAIVLLALIYIFKGPKETAHEIALRVSEVEEHNRRRDQQFHNLDKEVASSRQEIMGEMRRLSDAINHLARILEKAGLTTTGEHRIVKRRGD
jgi:hypothetical protein